MNSRGDDESAGRAGATGDEAARSVMQRQIELLICFMTINRNKYQSKEHISAISGKGSSSRKKPGGRLGVLQTIDRQ
jgi:hypothetical protein